jgi:hypothetical protein
VACRIIYRKSQYQVQRRDSAGERELHLSLKDTCIDFVGRSEAETP